MDEMLETFKTGSNPAQDTSVTFKPSDEQRALIEELEEMVQVPTAELPDYDLFEGYSEDVK